MKGSEFMLIHEELLKTNNTQMDWIHYYWESKRCNI